MLRVAVVGSGPAGIYAAGALTEYGDIHVDVLDRLPCPFGLVRYGVAPDHPKIKSISATLRRMLEHSAVRFLGNVEVGTDLSLSDLKQHYDAVIFSSGAALDRRLGIPGEDLPGSVSATDFVAWYSGHPDAPVAGYTLHSRSVAVVGAGNVAIDIARMLAKSAGELAPTDIPEHVLEVLDDSAVEEINLIARRGPAQAKFTTKELRELGELSNADVVVDPDELEVDESGQERAAREPRVRRNLEVLRDWSQRQPTGRPRRVRLRFLLRPVAVLGETGVTGLRVERTRLDAQGRAAGTGRMSRIDAQMVLRSVGYRGLAVPDLPFDEESGTIPNRAGRVLRDGVVAPGEYVAGWIKRGPTGVIGTNKRDAAETVSALLEDAASLPAAPVRDAEAVVRLLTGLGVQVVTWEGWNAIERAESELGRTLGRERAKITDRSALLAAASADRAERSRH